MRDHFVFPQMLACEAVNVLINQSECERCLPSPALRSSSEIGQLLAHTRASVFLEFHEGRAPDDVVDLRRIPEDDLTFRQLRGSGGVELPDLPFDLEGIEGSGGRRY